MPVACTRSAMATAVLLYCVGLVPSSALAQDPPRLAQATTTQAPAPAAPVPAPAAVSPSAPAPAQPVAPSAGPAVPAAPSPYSGMTASPAAPAATPAPSAASAPAPSPAATAPTAPTATPGAEAADAVPPGQTAVHAARPSPTGGAGLPHDLSPWGMFMAAAIVVKAVMVGLAFASVVTWTIWLVKMVELVTANRKVRHALHILRQSPTLMASARGLPKKGGAAARLVLAALAEVEASRTLPAEGIKERVAISLNRIEAGAGRRMSLGTGLLATIGSTAPFVGLFGTVWGIMNSFIGISKSQTTSLAVVAPGIAEALLATAIGLVAAIPAVIIYNVFARAISNYKASLSDTSSEVMRHLSRDLDREQAGASRLRAAAE
ncbi:MAG: tonB-system energizer ExbB [Azorhizobium sp. 35-67-5]|nr:MAG: tonB-system energizer ExbB [Azorhizobium sp. 35-67-5]